MLGGKEPTGSLVNGTSRLYDFKKFPDSRFKLLIFGGCIKAAHIVTFDISFFAFDSDPGEAAGQSGKSGLHIVPEPEGESLIVFVDKGSDSRRSGKIPQSSSPRTA